MICTPCPFFFLHILQQRVVKGQIQNASQFAVIRCIIASQKMIVDPVAMQQGTGGRDQHERVCLEHST